MAKLRVALLFGGRSVEHEVSIVSAAAIFRALDPSRYDVIPVAVDRDGGWRIGPLGTPPDDVVRMAPPASSGNDAIDRLRADASVSVDAVFPIIHGTGGEDGTLQGFLELAGLPYVGSGVLASAIAMDKDIAKRLLAAAGLPVVPWLRIRARELENDPRTTVDRCVAELGLPLFVKPAGLGSSVGTARVAEVEELEPALRDAARYDEKILAERAVDARELEVAVLGNETPEASVPGEIRPAGGFYDYEAKYVNEDTELIVPAELSDEQTTRIRELALEAYRVLESSGLARVDFFLDRESGNFAINELNTLPGFTEVSMYPRLWEASGLSYPALLDRLIELGLERHRRRAALETTYRRG